MVADALFSGSKVRHGTTSGWNKHREAGEKPCDACYRAKQAYDKSRRAATPEQLRSRLNARAQMAAYRTLAHKYSDEYAEVYRAEKARLFAEAGLTDGRRK